MASPRKQFFLIALFIMLSNDPTVALPKSEPDKYRICMLYRKTHVIVENDLGENETLTVHCKSGDDNLGVHQLSNGQSYEFHFHPNIWATTLFFCGLSWSGGHTEFDAYKYTRDCYYKRCLKRCVWKATKDGVLGYQDTKPPKRDIIIFWDNGPK